MSIYLYDFKRNLTIYMKQFLIRLLLVRFILFAFSLRTVAFMRLLPLSKNNTPSSDCRVG
jgi:hypothetical protein